MAYDRDRLKALVHYICWKCSDPTMLGAVKLYKILWATDFSRFYETGQSMTGTRYIKQQYGPVPSGIIPALQELQEEAAIRITEAPHFQFTQKRFTALKVPDTTGFTSEELERTDEMINLICGQYTAKSISEATHDHIWQAAADGEEIPHFTIFATPGKIDKDDLEWAASELETLGG